MCFLIVTKTVLFKDMLFQKMSRYRSSPNISQSFDSGFTFQEIFWHKKRAGLAALNNHEDLNNLPFLSAIRSNIQIIANGRRLMNAFS